MSDILMTNIFFLITAISSIITTILLVIVLIYAIKLIKKIKNITETVEDETVRIMSDVEDLRVSVKQNIGLIRGVASATFIKSLVEKIFTKK